MAANDPIILKRNAGDTGFEEVLGASAVRDALSAQPLATVLTNTTASFTTAQESKLASIATGATANSPDATLLARANHTGTQAVSTISPVSSSSLIGRHAGGSGAAQEVSVGNGLEFSGSGIRRQALTGDVTASAGSNATAIALDVVTNAKLANVATATVKGRLSAGTGDPEDVTLGALKTALGTALSPRLGTEFFNDFLGGGVSLGGGLGNYLGNGGTTNMVQEVGRRGVYDANTGTNASTFARAGIGTAFPGGIYLGNGSEMEFHLVFSESLALYSDALTGFKHHGFFPALTVPTPAGIMFRSTNGGNWFFVCSNGTTETAIDTGVASTLGVYRSHRIVVAADLSSATAYMDGSLVGTITTNLPTTSQSMMLGQNNVRTSTTGTAVGVRVDSMYIRMMHPAPLW
jgi:hypothetical protein